MSVLKSLCASASQQLATSECRIHSKLSMARTSVLAAFGGVLLGCANAPTTTAKHAVVEKILPTASGFVVCTDCGPFQPTVKRGDSHPMASSAMAVTTVPVAQSLAANEHIVADRLPAPVGKPKAIRIFFATNDVHISAPEAQRLRAFLDGVAGSASLSITGYTDGTGKYASNLRLADRRANTVKEFVTASNASRQVSISRAANCCPEAPDATIGEHARNRHVEITVIQ